MLVSMTSAMRLLELTTEYAAAKEGDAWGDAIPGKPARSLEDIASDYGQALRELLG